MNDIQEMFDNFFATKEVKQILKEKIDDKVQMLLDDKEKEFEELAEKRLRKEIDFFNKTLTKYVNETIDEFLQEHQKQVARFENDYRLNTVLESLTVIFKTLGINVQEILEGVNDKHELEINDLTERIDNLKKQLMDEQQNFINYKNKVLESEKKTAYENRNEKNSIINEKNNALRRLEKKIKILEDENDKLSQKELINELQSDLSLAESERFEREAQNIPYSKDNEYIESLESLKNDIIEDGKRLNEVTTDENAIPDSLKHLL